MKVKLKYVSLKLKLVMYIINKKIKNNGDETRQ